MLATLGPAVALADEDTSVVVQTAAGERIRGRLHQLRDDWSMRVGAGEGKLVPGRDVLAVRAVGVALPPFPAEDHLLLANGDRIPFQSLRLEGDRLLFRHPLLADGKDASVPVGAVTLLWRTAPQRTTDAESLRRRLLAQTRSRDVILLRNGDQVAGVLDGLDERKATMEVDRKEVNVPLSQVAAIALNTELADRLRPQGACARVVLNSTEPSGGGRMLLSSASCSDGKTLVGRTVFGARLQAPLSAVVALDVQQPGNVYLSDLEPGRYAHEPYLDDPWPVARDGNVAGHDLQVGGETYDKGISLHSQSRLSYRLAGRYRRLQARVGLDDRDGRQGSVRIRLLADGKPLDVGLDAELTHAAGPRDVNVSVAGVEVITLEVLFGANGNVQDVVDWADARLIR